jgi:hypothetical protein
VENKRLVTDHKLPGMGRAYLLTMTVLLLQVLGWDIRESEHGLAVTDWNAIEVPGYLKDLLSPTTSVESDEAQVRIEFGCAHAIEVLG